MEKLMRSSELVNTPVAEQIRPNLNPIDKQILTATIRKLTNQNPPEEQPEEEPIDIPMSTYEIVDPEAEPPADEPAK